MLFHPSYPCISGIYWGPITPFITIVGAHLLPNMGPQRFVSFQMAAPDLTFESKFVRVHGVSREKYLRKPKQYQHTRTFQGVPIKP